MPKAFIFVNVVSGSETEVLKRIREIPEIKEASLTYGVYDIVAKAETESMDRLTEVITSKVRGLDKIKSTLTTIVMEEK